MILFLRNSSLRNLGVKGTITEMFHKGFSGGCATDCDTPVLEKDKNKGSSQKSSSGSNNYVGGTLHQDLQRALNRQLHTELTAAYSYMALENYFERRSVGLKGFALAQRQQVSEELNHAQVISRLLTIGDANVILDVLHPPQPQEWPTPLAAVKASLDIEVTTAKGLAAVQNLAQNLGDLHVAHTIQTKLMDEQMECIHKLVQLVGTLETCSSPTCLLLIDQQLHRENS